MKNHIYAKYHFYIIGCLAIYYCSQNRFLFGNSGACDSWYYFGLSTTPKIANWQSVADTYYYTSRIALYLPQSLFYHFDLKIGQMGMYLVISLSSIYILTKSFSHAVSEKRKYLYSTVIVFSSFALSVRGNSYNALDIIFVVSFAALLSRMTHRDSLIDLKDIGTFAFLLVSFYFYGLKYLVILLPLISYILIKIILSKKDNRLKIYSCFILSLGVSFTFWIGFYRILTGTVYSEIMFLSQIRFALSSSSNLNWDVRTITSNLISPSAIICILAISIAVFVTRKIENHSKMKRLPILLVINSCYALLFFILPNSNPESVMDFQSSPYFAIFILSSNYYIEQSRSLKEKKFMQLAWLVLILEFASNTYIQFEFFAEMAKTFNFENDKIVYIITLGSIIYLSYKFLLTPQHKYFILVPSISFLLLSGGSTYGYAATPKEGSTSYEMYSKVYKFHKKIAHVSATEFNLVGNINSSVDGAPTAIWRSFWGASARSCMPVTQTENGYPTIYVNDGGYLSKAGLTQ
jgi:hypothetical protein